VVDLMFPFHVLGCEKKYFVEGEPTTPQYAACQKKQFYINVGTLCLVGGVVGAAVSRKHRTRGFVIGAAAVPVVGYALLATLVQH
jgi:hypothetical protein